MVNIEICDKCGYSVLTFANEAEKCPVCNNQLQFVNTINTKEFTDMNIAEREYFIRNYVGHDFDNELKYKRQDYKAVRLNEIRGQNKPQPKCPTCGSTYVQKIGGIERGVSVGVLGLFSKKINKSYKCKNCDYTW